jgi:glycosyltransferase involved in cell wall biosynthesis
MKKPLRIGIDGRVLGVQCKGIARYIWQLCKGLDVVLPEAEFYLYSRDPTGLPKISSRWHERSEGGWARWLPKSLWAVVRPGFLANQDGIDVFWGGTGLLPLIGLSARSVLTVHDLVYRVMPESMSFKARWAMKLFFERSLLHADFVVTNSRGTAKRLESMTGHLAVAVVPPGVSSRFIPQNQDKIDLVLKRYALTRPYVLGVATLEPRKGIDTLVRSFSSLHLKHQLPDHILVLAGDRGWRDADLARLLGQSGPRIMSLGFVEDEDLVALYSGCDVFVYPSKYEGFGMPVLEARACGARVVTSDLPELREAGGSEAIYVESNETGVEEGILAAVRTSQKNSFSWNSHSWIKSSSILAAVLTGDPGLKSNNEDFVNEL